MATFTNSKSGESITSTLSNAEAARIFAENFGDQHWLQFWIHKYANQARQQQPQANGAVPENGKKSAQFLGDLFIVAIGYGLKRPMIRLHYKDQRFKIYLSARGTLCVKSGMLAPDPTRPSGFGKDPVGDEFYIGYIAPQGYFRGACQRIRDQRTGEWRDGPARQVSDTEKEFLQKLSADPIAFMAECSKDMCRCCYCNKPLEDDRSKTVGYGATCAKHWGLPWGAPEHYDVSPNFPRSYNQTFADLCMAIRKDPHNEAKWTELGNALAAVNLPRCEAPRKGVVVPRL